MNIFVVFYLVVVVAAAAVLVTAVTHHPAAAAYRPALAVLYAWLTLIVAVITIEGLT